MRMFRFALKSTANPMRSWKLTEIIGMVVAAVVIAVVVKACGMG